MTRNFNFQMKSLKSICINYTINNIAEIVKLNREGLAYLPNNVKDRLLSKFTVSSHFWRNVNLKKILSLLVHQNVKHIDLTCIVVDDEILEIIEKCSELSDLTLMYVGVHSLTSKGLVKFFSKMHKLSIVKASHCDAIDDNVCNILFENNPNLIGLDIGGCFKVTDKSLVKLSNMNKLGCLNLSETKITNAGLEQVVKGSSGKNLVELRISSCPNLTENVLKSVTENCNSLQILIFSNNQLDQFGENLESDKLKNLKQLTWTISW
ncbi:protein AMN1 homolog [Agrilus planipennis]|uniref:Protein AMN1 homolog n=1 Tax=Agrilus planipennis TaxID=224129 RepID=A0A7F5RMK8_AGRPL|nr:protein AMN1 homolog [Agrilus planipennis]XP_025837269.1 protein AMN1 homolog [Agrilus planipennis]